MRYTHMATYLFTSLCHELDNEVNLYVKSLINQNSWHSIKADKEIKQKKKYRAIAFILCGHHFHGEGWLIRGGRKGQRHGCLI